MLTRRTYNLLLLAWCFFTFIFCGRADKKTPGGPKKILVAQLAKMGDMVCTTPMFRAIKKKYPDSKLYVMGDAVNKELLNYNRDIDGYIVFEKDFKKMTGILSREKFDFAALTGPSPETLFILYLSQIPHIAAPSLEGGFSPINTRSYKLLLKLVSSRPHKIGNYAPREYLRLLEEIGIFADDTRKYLNYSEGAQKKVLQFYQEQGIEERDLVVGIFPSTGNKIKLWGRDKFAKVADSLYEKYNAKIILIGSGSDKKEGDEFLANLSPSTKIINAFGAFNIDELKAAISKMSILISVDTGPIYIAEAFDVGTVDIVGPVDENDQPPRGERHRIAVAPRKKHEMGVFNARVYDEKEARRQSEDISAEMVLNETEELIRFSYTPSRFR